MLTAPMKITLLFVVFVDLLGQGLVFPIIDVLILKENSDFLPKDTSTAKRNFFYGLVIGVFFLSWFLGVVYLARVSDAIGRKNALLFCLAGALSGYVLTIISVLIGNLWLMILGRAITGFTAGNQPIAQAAMIDGSKDDADRDRNMGLLVIGVSLGLVGGPIIGGVLSDKDLIGAMASNVLPLYASFGLVLIAMLLVIVFLRDSQTDRKPFVFRPMDIVDSMLKIREHPLVLRLMPVYVAFMIGNVTFYVFVDNYLTGRFGYGIVGGSVAMAVVGFSLAISGGFLVDFAQKRWGLRNLAMISFPVLILCCLAFVAIPIGPVAFLPPFIFYLFFGMCYPMMLGVFSGAVGPEDQGWVMGVTTAVFCLAGGIMSLLGGVLTGLDIRLPYYIAAAALTAALLFLSGWRDPEIKRLTAAKTQD